ncbi:uncharacterized protein LOC133708204 [Rosa rugosa]|uniref:uncharacterized protein LOC133708204 n=1 Tax=Rosa rugosa TaxID=74645 RepID=UPI002B40CA51|nr:uncharacterized protein LOC133708204 [Rosa rugosa]
MEPEKQVKKYKEEETVSGPSSIKNDAVAKVLGPDPRGRVRGDSILDQAQGFKSTPIGDCSLGFLPESFDWASHGAADATTSSFACVGEENGKGLSKPKGGYLCNWIKSRLVKPAADWGFDSGNGEDLEEIDVLLLRLNGIGEEGDRIVEDENGGLVQCSMWD